MRDASPLRAAHVALGSNLDDPVEHIRRALHELGQLPRTRVLARSSLYRSAPVGKLDQPQFVNAVARLDTQLAPAALLGELLRIEQRHGRVRTEANAPRTLDLDLLLYGDEVISAPGLAVPHPRMHERAFVLRPLVEVSPEVVIPGRGRAADLLPSVVQQDAIRIDG